MSDIEDAMWDLIDKEWPRIWKLMRLQLPIAEHKMYDNDGNVVEAGRPMSESIICSKQRRERALLFYLLAANVVDLPDNPPEIETDAQGNRQIKVGTFSRLEFQFGGSRAPDVHRESSEKTV